MPHQTACPSLINKTPRYLNSLKLLDLDAAALLQPSQPHCFLSKSHELRLQGAHLHPGHLTNHPRACWTLQFLVLNITNRIKGSGRALKEPSTFWKPVWGLQMKLQTSFHRVKDSQLLSATEPGRQLCAPVCVFFIKSENDRNVFSDTQFSVWLLRELDGVDEDLMIPEGKTGLLQQLRQESR